MKDHVQTGSYVIRNKHTLAVIHVDNPNSPNATLNKKWSVVACEQNESRYPEQQVWWIEPSPTCGEDGEEEEEEQGVTYSITNTATGKCLDANLGGVNAYNTTRQETTKGEWRLVAYENRGAPWQKWRIENVSEDKDEPYYRIANVWNNELLSIARSGAESGESGPRCNIGKPEPSPVKNWELVVPIVAFPPGWCRIQNSKTHDLLTQAYLANPPVLLKPSGAPPTPPEFREGWGCQWALAHTSYLFPNFRITTGPNTWCVRNRLTGGYLGCIYSDRYPFVGGNKVSANDWDLSEEDIAGHTWRLEIDPSCTMNWKLIHHRTGCLLEGTARPRQGGVEVACVEKKFIRGDRDKTWLLTSPVVEKAEAEAPPEYESPAGEGTDPGRPRDPR